MIDTTQRTDDYWRSSPILYACIGEQIIEFVLVKIGREYIHVSESKWKSNIKPLRFRKNNGSFYDSSWYDENFAHSVIFASIDEAEAYLRIKDLHKRIDRVLHWEEAKRIQNLSESQLKQLAELLDV